LLTNISKEVEKMKTRLLLSLFGALLIGTVGLTGGDAFAKKVCDDGSSPPCNGGGGGGGTAPDYGDLIILYRDATGVPILDAFDCQQPIGFPANVGCPAAGLLEVDGALVIPTDPDTCAIEPTYATCANEADFGRINLSRATEKVLDSQLEDVLVNLAIADCTSLDPAGRIVYSRYIGDELSTGTVDSPLQNLSILKHLMRDGDIGVPLPQGATALQTAARGFGVAMDKAGQVNIDLLVYLNEIMGLTVGTTILGDPICINVREEVMGSMEYVEKCFLNYGAYAYDRTTNFGALPSPAYIPEGAAIDGWFEFLFETSPGNFAVTFDAIMTVVFLGDPGFVGGSIGGFAQAADDTRAVINFMHTYEVPPESATEVPCAPIPNPTDQYDLSISEKSGLKVPKQVVASTEGREFIVSVDNAGPDTAAGTVVVTAVRADGGDVLVDGLPGPFVFTFADLLPGLSFSTGQQIFTLGEPHDATTITWTAEAVPEFVDPNPGNNEVTIISNVRPASGGGGH